ncbi:MAG TPA: hypothetical protein VM658_14565 [bacterium]|nr:hypothetical protein [bacterium]
MTTTTLKDSSLVVILSKIEEMSMDDVRGRIGAARFSALHGADERPMFVTLLAGHEGWSTGSLTAGAGPKRKARKRWARAVISELAHKLRSGVPVFLFHGGSRGRRPVGEIVAAAERWVKGVLGAEGLAYISDPEVKERIKAGELDTCSIEAEVECHRDPRAPGDSWIVDTVRKVTGVALGDSRLVRPGFPGAALLAAVEEFEADGNNAGAEAEKISALEARLKSRDDELQSLSAELAAVKARDEESRRSREAGSRAEKILAGKNVSHAERSIILDEIKKRPPAGSDLETAVSARVEDELQKISRLRELWARERVAAPPEKISSDSMQHNPLIPRTKGW